MHQLIRRIALAQFVAMGLGFPALAQEPTLPSATVPATEASALAEGWTFLAQGRYDDAAKATAPLLDRYPRNPAALSLAIEVEIARHGADGALARYEGWLSGRRREEPGVLRRVARAFLHEWGRQTREGSVRLSALKALSDDGEADAASVLGPVTAENARATAAAVERLSTTLKATPGLKLREIARLGETGSPRAVPVLVPVLADPRPENRAAAAEALGLLGGQQALVALKPLLNDPHGVVRVAAAGALFKHGDFSGAAILQELAGSEHAAVRRTAALFMAAQPDESWKALVRGLASDPDPAIQLDAARLLAPHDPEASRAIVDRLLGHSDLAIRELAAAVAAEAPINDLAMLRRLMHDTRGRIKVRAATRVLELTR